MHVLVIHGPNLNLIGEREPSIYGTQTLAEIDRSLRDLAAELGADLETAQYSGEGQIINALHAARSSADAIVLNPGAYAHYAHAIADAVAAIAVPVIEVHLSNIFAREPFRRTSVVAPVCRGTIVGFGADSYRLALRAAVNLASGRRP
mgnify:CR=1 FL=1